MHNCRAQQTWGVRSHNAGVARKPKINRPSLTTTYNWYDRQDACSQAPQ